MFAIFRKSYCDTIINVLIYSNRILYHYRIVYISKYVIDYSNKLNTKSSNIMQIATGGFGKQYQNKRQLLMKLNIESIN